MTLTELAERAEKATGPSRDLDAQISRAVGGYSETKSAFAPEPFTASIDAAMSLVPEGWGWMIHWPENSQYRYARVVNPAQAVGGARDGYAATPALALVAAAFRAREAK